MEHCTFLIPQQVGYAPFHYSAVRIVIEGGSNLVWKEEL
jgi:hypothetical protein